MYGSGRWSVDRGRWAVVGGWWLVAGGLKLKECRLRRQSRSPGWALQYPGARREKDPGVFATAHKDFQRPTYNDTILFTGKNGFEIIETFEFKGVAGGIHQKHRRLLPDLALKTYLWFDHEFDSL